MRDAVDMAKRVVTKEKIDRQLSEQSGATTPFIKVGEVHYSNNETVSFNNIHDLIRQQLDSLNRPFKPQIHQKKRRGKADKILVIEIEIDHSVETDKDKTLDLTVGDNHKTDIYNMDIQ